MNRVGYIFHWETNKQRVKLSYECAIQFTKLDNNDDTYNCTNCNFIDLHMGKAFFSEFYSFYLFVILNHSIIQLFSHQANNDCFQIG